MDASNAANVLEVLGTIEDAMAASQHEWGQAAAARALNKELVKRAEAAIFLKAEGTDKTRQAHAQVQVSMTDQWETLVNAEATLARLDKLYDSLNSRRSIGQSALKQLQHEQEPRYGQAAHHRGDEAG